MELVSFVNQNKDSLILLGLIPLIAIRGLFNIITHNVVYDSSFIPLFQNWQKGGHSVGAFCMLVFWWTIRENDTKTIVTFKKVANIISILSVIISVICFGLIFFFANK